MNICLVSSKFPPIIGGGETQVFLLAKFLSKNGHEVTVITDSLAKNQHKNIKFKVCYVSGFEKFCSGKGKLREPCDQLFNFISNNSFDIVHVHNFMPMFLVSIFRELIKAKIVFTFHNTPNPPKRILGYFSNYKVDLAFARKIIQECKYDYLIQGSKFYYKWALRLGSDPQKTELIYMGVDQKKFSPNLKKKKSLYRKELGISPDKFLITLPTRMIERKGVFETLSALSILKREGFQKISLFLPGMFAPFDKNVSEKVKGMIKELNLGQNVFLPRSLVSYEEMPKVYAASDLVVMPSYYEGLGLAVIEAMSVGIPVIGTNVCGIKEIIKNGQNGFLIEPKSDKALAKAIKKLVKENPILGYYFSRNGIKTVSERFTIEKQVFQTENTYQNLIKNK